MGKFQVINGKRVWVKDLINPWDVLGSKNQAVSTIEPDTQDSILQPVLISKLHPLPSGNITELNSKPNSQPNSTPISKPNSQLNSKPEPDAVNSKPISQLFSQPISKPNSQLNSKPNSQLNSTPISKPNSQLNSKPEKPFNLRNFIAHLPQSEFNTLSFIMRHICDTGTLYSYEIMQSRDIGDIQGKKRQLVFKEISALIRKNIIKKEPGKRGKNGHTIFHCTQEIKSIWIEYFLDANSKPNSQLNSSPNSKPNSQLNSSPNSNLFSNPIMEEEGYLDIKENSSSVLNEFLVIDRTDFDWLDEKRVNQIMKYGTVTPESFEIGLDEIRFAKKTGYWDKLKVDNEPSYVMAAFRENGRFHSVPGYLTPEQRILKLKEKELEQKRVEVEQINKLQDEAQELDFELWVNKLPKSDLETIYKGHKDLKLYVSKINIKSILQRPALKEYFIENK